MATKKTTGRKRMFLALGSLVGVASLVTAAAFTDWAAINLGDGSGGGFTAGKFNVQIQQTDAAGVPVTGWQEADATAVNGAVTYEVGAELFFEDADQVILGYEAEQEIDFRNDVAPDSTVAAKNLKLTMQKHKDPAKPSDDALYNALRYTIEADTNGTYRTLVNNVPASGIANVETLVAELAPGAEGTLRITVSLPDNAANQALDLEGLSAYPQLLLNATPIS